MRYLIMVITTVCLFFYANINATELKQISSEQLKQIINDHKEWQAEFEMYERREDSKSDWSDPRIADLSDSNLNGLDMSGVVLNFANLSGISLNSANLNNATLRDVKLTDAKLANADLIEVNLSKSDLRGADMFSVRLNGANLTEADLSGANLSYARMQKVDLRGAELKGANLSGANLSRVIFEPASLPPVFSASNIHEMIYTNRPEMLVRLRNAFLNAGYREEERAVTYILNNRVSRSRDRDIWYTIENGFKFIFFNLPTQWGIVPRTCFKNFAGASGVILVSLYYRTKAFR